MTLFNRARPRRPWPVVPGEALERRVLMSVVPLGDEFRVNTHTVQDQRDAAVATDAAGNFVVVWASRFNADDEEGVYAQRYSAAGVSQGGEFRVNTHTTNTQGRPDVAMEPDGDFVVVWESEHYDLAFQEVIGQRFSRTGARRGGEFRVNQVTADRQIRPSVDVDADGDFVVAWSGNHQPGGEVYDVYARRYGASGAPLSGEFRVNAYTTGRQRDNDVALDAGGDFVVVWHGGSQGDPGGYGILARRYDAAGAPLDASEFRVSAYSTLARSSPSVAAAPDGAFVVAWHDDTHTAREADIFARRFDPDGLPLSGEFQVNTHTVDQQEVATAAVSDDGSFVIVWESAAQDGSLFGVYGQCFDPTGAPRGSEFRANTYTADLQRLPAVAMDPDGDFVVAWHSDEQDGSTYGIFAQRYGITPRVVESAFAFETAPHALRFTFDRDVSGSLSTADLVVESVPAGTTFTPAQVSYHASTETATFTFAQPLPDGRYRATLLGAGVETNSGAALAADHLFDFFFLRGDANRDARVNLSDFNILAGNFGQSNLTFSQGDFNYDGTVNLSDFNILAARFGQAVGPAGAAPTMGANDDVDDDDGADDLLE